MKKLLLVVILACLALSGSAQRPSGGSPAVLVAGTPTPPGRWKEHQDSVFQYIDRSPVGTGLLTDYGFALLNYGNYNGVALHDSNYADIGSWRLLYAAMQTSVFNANANLPSMATANARISTAERAGPVVFATLLAHYNSLRPDAATQGLVYANNGRLYDSPGRSQSPYQERTLIAVAPTVLGGRSRTVQFTFPASLRFTNAAPAITALAFDAGDGAGFRSVAWDQVLSVNYPGNGTKQLTVRLTCADGAVLLSHANYEVNEPPASRYNGTRFGNNIEMPTTALFTDTRTFTDQVSPFLTSAATGTVTIAYATNNSSNTIRKPLIVIEGYDGSTIIGPDFDYDYNSFVLQSVLGGIFVPYTQTDPGDRPDFNAQLSEVGDYDLIFLNFTNGVDYMQRNAFLVERLIQWVNDNKQPYNGVRQQNVVLGMSMGGLIARYALRDMEVRHDDPNINGPDHDTRLYISHEAPHQGANVPVGVQFAVRDLANMTLVPGLRLASVVSPLDKANQLLLAPASQQLLIYNVYPQGSSLHASWLAAYNQLGYPIRCRNVATSNGSECATPQAFGPYGELVRLVGSGMLSKQINQNIRAGTIGAGLALGGVVILTGGGTLAAIPIITTFALFSLGNYEGSVDFVINALPDQQVLRVYSGRFSLTKNLLGLIPIRVLHYVGSENSSANMLPYDSAPGGLYDLAQVVPNVDILATVRANFPIPLSQSTLRTAFCFVPTTSALDIGGGNVAQTPQSLTNSYSNASPPAAPFNTPFASFITAGRENLTHILWDGLNSKWAFLEMQNLGQPFDCQGFCQANPVITGANAICIGNTTYTINVPANTLVTWNDPQPAGLATIVGARTGTSVVLTPTAPGTVGGSISLTATISSVCGQFTVASNLLSVGLPASPATQGPDWGFDCGPVTKVCRIDNYDPLATYVINVSGALSLVGTGVQPNGTYSVRSGPVGGATGHIEIMAHNGCGDSNVSTLDVITPCGDNGFAATLYPNPARESVDVHFTRGHADAAHPVTVRLFDGYGQLRAEQTSADAAIMRLPTAQLPTGLYFVHILHGGRVLSRQQLRIEQ